MSREIKKSILLLLAGVIILALADPVAQLPNKMNSISNGAHQFALELDQKTEFSIDVIEKIQHDITSKGIRNVQYGRSQFFQEMYAREGVIIFVFRNDELALWSHNALSPQLALQVARRGTEIHQFDNGWYRLLYFTNGIEEYVAAILIKNSFKQANKYLKSEFIGSFKIPMLKEISSQSSPGWVKLKADHQYFYLSFSEDDSSNILVALLYSIFSILGGFLILLSLLALVRQWIEMSGTLLFLTLVVSVFGLRIWSITAGWPNYLTKLKLFDPAIYASSHWYPSLADFAINNIIVLVLALMARFVLLQKNERLLNWYRHTVQFMMFLLLFAFGLFVNALSKGLVLNSNIPFEIDNITGLNTYSYIALPSLSLLFLAFVLLCDTTVIFFEKCKIALNESLLSLGIATLLFIIATHLLGIKDLGFILWPPAVLFTIQYARTQAGHKNLKLIYITIIISIFAGVSSHNFIKYNAVREHNQRKILAEKLAINNDPVAELLFTEVKPVLLRDQTVKKLFFENDLHTRQVIEDYVIPRFFSGYLSKYDINMYIFQEDGGVWGKLPNVKPMPLIEIQKKIAEEGEPTTLDGQLFYLMRSAGLASYIALIPLHYTLREVPDGYFVFEFNTKLYPQHIGFPALLIDEASRLSAESLPYASAVYINGSLARARGNIAYQQSPKRFLKGNEKSHFVRQDGIEHLVSKVNDNTIVILSTEMKTFINKASTFSYLCAIFGIVYILAHLAANTLWWRQPSNLSLNQRIQLLLVLLTFASMVVFALATRHSLGEQYAEKNKRLLGEKLQSVLLEVKNKLEDEYELDYSQADYINRLLSQFSTVFFTDINLYSPEGDILASSQMRMFNEGLISRKANPAAFANLHYLGKIEYIHEEEIGKLKYISAYTPFYNKNGVLLAYLNLPYFGRQVELDQEISRFLVAVVNIFVLLLLLSVFVGLFMAQWITAPLRIIRESLSQMDPGKSNRLIDYNSQDEIGLLVTEYNAKIAELEHNSERLAQSERESAWREMAKQVAHEIKNPLTPMKLSVQHLQRCIDKGEILSNEQITKTTQNLNEQIDALSAIATAFSNFARMPHARFEIIDLIPVLTNASSLFSHVERVKITLLFEGLKTANVNADKEQMLRVFNNLIKNALQAIPNGIPGLVHIELKQEGGSYIISIADNGMGIDQMARQKIFVPNFTTKSHGMGLGLAMCKNIVENSGGEIWFNSSSGSGSIFFVKLPALD